MVLDVPETRFPLGRAAVAITLDAYSHTVGEEDPFRTEHHSQRLFRAGFFPAGHAVSTAIPAVDMALWDIKGRALGVPVYELLGGRACDRVVCYPHNAEASMDAAALVDSCLKAREKG